MKFRTRLFFFYIGGVCLTIFILSAYFIHFEETRIFRNTNDQLLIEGRLLANHLGEKLGKISSSELHAFTSRSARTIQARMTVIAPDGTVIADSIQKPSTMENHINRPEIKEALSNQTGLATRRSHTLKQDMLYVALPVTRDQTVIGVVRLAKSLTQQNALLSRVKMLIISGVLISAILALFSGAVALRKVIKPILELKRLTMNLSRGELSSQVRLFGQDELADLGQAFNTMSRQLTDSFALLREEKNKLEVILNNLTDGILVIDRQLRIVLANPSACNMLGLNQQTFEDRPILELVLNHHLLDLIQQVHQSQQPFDSELTLHQPEHRRLHASLAPLFDASSGTATGSIVVLRDLTHLRHLERVRQDFVANVSHELRTPITTIKAMTETLLGGAWKDEAILHHYLEATNKESDRMAELVNDLLTLARLDAGVSQSFEAFNLVEIIKEVGKQFRTIREKTHHFEILLPEKPLPQIVGNHNQIKQVLLNLLDNAFKYTPAGGRVSLTACAENGMIMISVADSGIGIPQADLNRIFERFYRVDKARSREMGGTGLGLSIVKHIVENHGGQIQVTSQPGEGSVFTVLIPAAPVLPSD